MMMPYSPPSKRDNFDKWAALGERRRAVAGNQSYESERLKAQEPIVKSENRASHSPFAYMAGQGVSDLGGPSTPQHYSSLPLGNVHNHSSSNFHHSANFKWTLHAKEPAPDRPKECPWTKGKVRNRDWTGLLSWRKDKHADSGDDGVGW